MGRTPDASDGPRIEESIIWEEQAGDPSEVRQTQYVQGKGLLILSDGVVRSVGEGREAYNQPPVDDRDVDTPPGSPVTGYRVVVGGSPTGDFVGHVGEIAQWDGSAWVFTLPKKGMLVYVRDEAALYHQTASVAAWTWVKIEVDISADTHKILRQLIHFMDDGPGEGFVSGAYKETLPSADLFPTSITWWESSSKLKRIVERTLTWTGVNLTTDAWAVYDVDGTTVLATVSDAIAYSGVFETSRTRTITVN